MLQGWVLWCQPMGKIKRSSPVWHFRPQGKIICAEKLSFFLRILSLTFGLSAVALRKQIVCLVLNTGQINLPTRVRWIVTGVEKRWRKTGSLLWLWWRSQTNDIWRLSQRGQGWCEAVKNCRVLIRAKVTMCPPIKTKLNKTQLVIHLKSLRKFFVHCTGSWHLKCCPTAIITIYSFSIPAPLPSPLLTLLWSLFFPWVEKSYNVPINIGLVYVYIIIG